MIKKAIKRTLKFFDPLFKKLGYNPFVANQDLKHFFSIIKKLGFEPKHIVDVGANHGMWTREALKYFPDSYYTLFEPQKTLENSVKDLLANPRIKLNTVGVGSHAGNFKLTIGKSDTESSFIYTEKDAAESGLRQIEVPIVTLNEFLGKMDVPTPDLIKIDAEGFDFEVLKGASDFIGKTEIFVVEVSVAIENLDNSFLKMMNFMDEKGYKIFEITHLIRFGTHGVLCLAELCFIKKNGFVDKHKKL
jgi:FkbM family methyltransferase